jgi:hypothetical protein
MKKIIIKCALILTIILTVVFLPTVGFAQANLNGEVTLSYLRLDDEGNRSSANELYDTFDGFNLQGLSAFGDINPHTRYFLKLEDINLDGRRAMLNLTDINLYKLKLDYRQSRLLYGTDTAKKNERKAYSGYLEVKPIEMMSGYVDYQGYKNEGDRAIADTTFSSLFGDKYDRTSSTVKGGLKGRYKNHQLDIAYGQRKYTDNNNDSLDSKTTFMETNFYGRISPKIKAVLGFDFARKKLEKREIELKENALSLSVLIRPIEQLTFAPSVNYRKVDGANIIGNFKAYRVGLNVDYYIPKNNTTLTGDIGYETRSVNDVDTYKSQVVSYSVGGRTRFNKVLAAKVTYSGENRKDPDKVLITGVEDKAKILAELAITPCKNADLKAGYTLNDRKNSDIDTKSNMGSLYGTLSTWYKDKVELSLEGNITDAKYEWGNQKFRYRYNSIDGTLSIKPNNLLTLNSNLTYFIFKHDVEQNKINVIASATYQFVTYAKFGISYQRYEFNESLFIPAHYDANIIKAEISANFSLK